MTIQDLIEVIESEYCGGDPKETIEELNDLLDMILHNPNTFLNQLSTDIEEYAERYNLCPCCGLELEVVDTYVEDHEFLGQPVTKQVNVYGCSGSNCSYVIE